MKKSILVVDDMELNRAILCEIFQQDYQMIEAENGEEALELIKGKENELAAVLLDIVMPVMDGFAALEQMNQSGFTKKVPVFLITAENTEESTIKGYEMGVMDVIGKPFVSHIVKRRIESVIELFHIRDRLSKKVVIQERELDEKRKELESLNRALVETLATAIEFRDCESGDHVRRIYDFTLFFLDRMEFGRDMDTMQKEEIAMAAILHDVGKIAIPDNILNKPGKLTNEEFEIMKSHTVQGCELLERIPEITHHPIYKYAYDICRHHHERWDGRGYPDGLVGEEISPWAQIVALADVYDALTTDRVYKKAFTHEESLRMILNGECGQFNPKLMDTLRDLSEEIKTMLLNRKKKQERGKKMDKKDILKAAGVDYEGALSRFMGNEALLARFLKKFLDDPNFLNLEAALEQGEAEKAFQAAHTLKGVAGNLSLSGLYEQAAKISEALRGGDLESAKAIMPDVKAAYKKITDALAQD